MGFVDTMEKLEILVGHAMILLIFLLIIFSMKRKRKNSNEINTPIPWTALLTVQTILSLTILPIWMFMGLLAEIMTTESSNSSTFFDYLSIFGLIATVILNVMALTITTEGLNEQREKENKQPISWVYVIIVIYILIIPFRFIIGN